MPNDDDIKFNRRFLAYFAVGLCLAAMAYIACVTFLPIPKDNVRFADTVIGFVMGTVLGTPIGFFFHSSKSSQTKDQALVAMVPTPPTPEPVSPHATEERVFP